MKRWLALGLMLAFSAHFLGCAGAQVERGDRLRILYTGDTWGFLVPTG